MEFPITSSPSSTVWIAGGIALLTLAIGALFAWFAVSASALSTSIVGDDLRIKVPIYGRVIPLSKLDLSSLNVINLDESPEFRPNVRTNGIGLPGYAVGWFRLGTGERALAAITERSGVVYLRTTEGYSLLLSLVNPELFSRELADRVPPS